MIGRTREQKMNRIKLITFDLDDTFWDISPVIIKAELSTRDFIEKHIGKREWGSMSDFLSYRQDLISQDPSFEWDIKALRKKIYENKIQSTDLSDDKKISLTNECYEFFLKLRHDVNFYDGVYMAIERLSKNYSLGVLTNGNADIFSFEIGKFFDFSISSVDVKSNKPDKAHFVEAKNKYKDLRYEEIVHIGDHPINDVVGASNLGINPIWFNGNDKDWPEGSISEPIQFNDWNKVTKLIEEHYE